MSTELLGLLVVVASAVVLALGGVIHQLLGLDLVAGLFAQRLLTVAGFALLVYSLYAHVDKPDGIAS